MPADTLASQVVPNPLDHIIAVGDVLSIRLWPDPDGDLGGAFPVEQSGYVYLPLLGRVWGSGRGLDDFTQELRARYGEVIGNPIVSVTPQFRVSVLGAVQRPGLYTVDPTYTAFDVISEAGGFASTASRSRVLIIRGENSYTLDAEAGLEGESSSLALVLRSNDRIVVPARSSVSVSTVLIILQSIAIIVPFFR